MEVRMKPSGWFIHPNRAIRDQVRFDRLLSAGPTMEVPLTTLGFGGGGDDMNDPFDAAAQVHASAREWHKLQLGVLGVRRALRRPAGRLRLGFARCGCRTSAESPRSPAWCWRS
jgi:hypothetical protein